MSNSSNFRLNLTQSPPQRQAPPPSPMVQTPKTKISSDDQLPTLSKNSALTTVNNPIMDENAKLSTIKAPYELQLSGDTLHYCYVSDSGVKYQGQLLSTSV